MVLFASVALKFLKSSEAPERCSMVHECVATLRRLDLSAPHLRPITVEVTPDFPYQMTRLPSPETEAMLWLLNHRMSSSLSWTNCLTMPYYALLYLIMSRLFLSLDLNLQFKLWSKRLFCTNSLIAKLYSLHRLLTFSDIFTTLMESYGLVDSGGHNTLITGTCGKCLGRDTRTYQRCQQCQLVIVSHRFSSSSFPIVAIAVFC